MESILCRLDDIFLETLFTRSPSAFLILCGALYDLKNGLTEVRLYPHGLSRQQFRTGISYLITIGFHIKNKNGVGYFMTNQVDNQVPTSLFPHIKGGQQPASNQVNNQLTPPPLPLPASPTSSFPPYPLSITTPSSTPTPSSLSINKKHVYKKGEITQKQAWDIACKFRVSFDSVKFCAAQMADWSASGGKQKYDWEATLRNWVRSSLQTGAISKLHPIDAHLRLEKYNATGEMT